MHVLIFQKLREELLVMKKYILLCADAMQNKLLLLIKSRQHFVDSSDIYSMKDLLDIQTDVLLSELAAVHSSWAQHIKSDCQVRGFCGGNNGQMDGGREGRREGGADGGVDGLVNNWITRKEGRKYFICTSSSLKQCHCQIMQYVST